MTAPNHVELAEMWAKALYEPQIHHIRFPRFRNLEDGLKLEFGHPITAIVGANGTNKSSILRALQGCPDYENIGRYWFGTALDIISPDERHRFIHGRWSQSQRAVVEVLKTRIKRRASDAASDPDYFEPSRPIRGDQMNPMPEAPDPLPADRTTTRWKAIEKPVVYVDFRAEISAFDKYFLHHDYRARRADRIRNREDLAARKALIRERSPRLKRILDNDLDTYSPGGHEWVLVAPRDLSKAEVDAVGGILGREYSRIEVVSHRVFEVTGATARLHTSDFSYTEAWAGSGEFAAVQVVTNVANAKPHSLILLDEPEVSLHPGAQRRLLAFLASESKARKLQIVFATHSPVIIEDLPPVAIKVLEIQPTTHRVTLRSQESSATEAFTAIEHRFEKKTVLVEDALAREIVLRAMRGAGGAQIQAIDVVVQVGGSSQLRGRAIPFFASLHRSDVLVYLDGDQRLNPALEAPDRLAPADLQGEACRLLGVHSLDGYVAANTGGITEDQLRGLLAWAQTYLRYLPGGQPEAWLRDQVSQSSEDALREDRDAKSWWSDVTAKALGKTLHESVVSKEILECQKQLLAKLDDEGADLVAIRADIATFLERL